jgi:hypothetical protein
MEVPPVIIHFSRIFPWKSTIQQAGGTPICGNPETPISPKKNGWQTIGGFMFGDFQSQQKPDRMIPDDDPPLPVFEVLTLQDIHRI